MSEIKHINCSEAVARLYDYLDQEGPKASLEEVNQHLEICRHCCDRFTFEVALWKEVRNKGQQACCPESLKSRVKDLLSRY